MSVITRTVMGGSSVIGGNGVIGRGVVTGGDSTAPPEDTFHILTEDGNVLTTESGDRLRTEP